MNGVGTHAQTVHHIPDEPEVFREDVLRSGQSIADPVLVDHLIENSSAAIKFLEEINVNLDLLSQCGGHQFPRTHRSQPDPTAKFQRNIGSIITNALAAQLEKQANVKIWTSSPVTELKMCGKGVVCGVQVNGTQEYHASAVILASGGYGRDERLLKEYRPDLEHFPSTNGDWSTGDGVHLARRVSAALTGMEHVQVHPTGIIDPKQPTATNKFLAAEAIRAGGAILVNQRGERFVNELGLRDHVTEAIFQACDTLPESELKFAYMILNQDVIDFFGAQTMSFYQKKGFLASFDNAQALAEHYQIPRDELLNSLHQYNQAKESNSPDSFGKDRFPTSFDPEAPIYAFRITPSIHYTMGGVKIDTTGQVFGENGLPIQGLYAAGEVSGGVHGKNRLAGNSLLECVVFGRSAGTAASRL